MESSIRLYSLSYSEKLTYLAAALFIACNIALPQVFHLIPQGGVIFSPLSLVIMVGAYKLGWRAALLAAVASPIVNHAANPAITASNDSLTAMSVITSAAGIPNSA